jgi:hypothetical protein
MLAGKEAALDVEVEGALPGGLVELDRAAHGGVANIVVQHVDLPVGGGHASHELGHSLRVGDVAGVGRGTPALAQDDADRFLRGRQADVDTDDVGAVACRHRCRRLAVAPAWADGASPEDDRGLVPQTIGHLPDLLASLLVCLCRPSLLERRHPLRAQPYTVGGKLDIADRRSLL